MVLPRRIRFIGSYPRGKDFRGMSASPPSYYPTLALPGPQPPSPYNGLHRGAETDVLGVSTKSR
jgi:hypothetical protein